MGSGNRDVPLGKANLEIFHLHEKTVEECRLNVVLQITGIGSAERPGLDLVTVLDVSGSMEKEKLKNLKEAMQYVIKKLVSKDRLSIIKFFDKGIIIQELTEVTEDFKRPAINLVSKLVAGGNTNIYDGLTKAMEVVKGRNDTNGRSVAIMLMSDGKQNRGGDASKFKVGDVPVFTFGFGRPENSVKMCRVR